LSSSALPAKKAGLLGVSMLGKQQKPTSARNVALLGHERCLLKELAVKYRFNSFFRQFFLKELAVIMF